MAGDTETVRMSRADWETLFRQHFPAVERYFASHGVGPADADDLAQEVFKGLARCQVPLESETYVLAMARNILSRYRRGRAREQVVLGGYSQYCQADRKAVAPRAFGEGTSEGNATDELLKTVTHGLPAADAELAALRFREGLSVPQIARRMKCTESAVWKRLQRLRVVLQRGRRQQISGAPRTGDDPRQISRLDNYRRGKKLRTQHRKI